MQNTISTTRRFDAFRQNARLSPSAVAVRSTRGSTTYRDLAEGSDSLKASFAANGIKAGDTVAIELPPSASLVAAIIASTQSMVTYVYISHLEPDDRRVEIRRSANCVAVVYEHGPEIRIRPLQSSEITTMRQQNRANVLGQPKFSPYTIHTSGTSGSPKVIQASEYELSRYLDWAFNTFVGSGRTVSSLLHTSMAFDFSLPVFWLPLMSGGTLHVRRPQAGLETLYRDIKEAKPSYLRLTPTQVDAIAICSTPIDGPDPESIMVGGEVLWPRQLETIKRFFPESTVYNHYGPAETTIGRCIQRLDKSHGFDLQTYPMDVPVPVGSPIGTTEIRIDRTGVGAVTGEILIRDAVMENQYLERAPHGNTSFKLCAPGQQYPTGDNGFVNEHGQFVVLGRLDSSLVKIRGYRVSIHEVESVLQSIPCVRQCIAFADETGSLVATVASDDATADAQRLRQQMLAKLPSYAVPGRFVFLAALPLTPNGKLDRKTIIKQHGDDRQSNLYTKNTARAGDEVSAATALKRACEEVLGCRTIDMQLSFITSGGNSISALLVANKLHDAGIPITAQQILLAPSIAEAHSDSRRNEKENTPPELFSDKQREQPMLRWFMNLSLGDINLYQQGIVLTMPYETDLKTLSQAVTKTVENLLPPAADYGGMVSGPRLYSRVNIITEQDREELQHNRHLIDGQINLDQGLVAAAAASKLTKPRVVELYLTAHHAVVDTVSWHIAVDGIANAYAAMRENREDNQSVQTAVTNDCKRREIGLNEEAYWRLHAHPIRPPSPPRPLGPSTYTRLRTATEPANPHRIINIDEVDMLEAYITAIAEIQQTSTVGVVLERHGRSTELSHQYGAQSQLGWNTALCPQIFVIDPVANHAESRKCIERQIQNIPNGAEGYLRSRAAATREPYQTHDFGFNFLGAAPQTQVLTELGWSINEWAHWTRASSWCPPQQVVMTSWLANGLLHVRMNGTTATDEVLFEISRLTIESLIKQKGLVIAEMK